MIGYSVSQLDLRASVVNNSKKNYTTETPRSTEAQRNYFFVSTPTIAIRSPLGLTAMRVILVTPPIK